MDRRDGRDPCDLLLFLLFYTSFGFEAAHANSTVVANIEALAR